jgi:hypothetical protein
MDNLFRHSASGRTSGDCYDAEGAFVIASILSFDERTGSHPHTRNRVSNGWLEIESFLRKIENEGRKLIFLAVVDHPDNSWQLHRRWLI